MNMSHREKLLLAAALVLSIIYGFNRFVLHPLDQKNHTTQIRIQTMRGKIKLLNIENRLQGLRASRTVSLRNKYKALADIIPHDNSSTPVFKLVHRLILDHGLTLKLLEEDGKETGDAAIPPNTLKSYLIICEADGKYKDIRNFLNDVESQPRLIVVEKFAVENSVSEEPTEISVEDISRGRFVLRIYYDQ